MSALFQSFKLKSATLRNRIVVSPMCQYASVEGVATDWHQVHYPSLARGGAGLVVLEATAVSPEGRITPGCAGLWTREQANALGPLVRSIKAAGAVAGIQLSHAGRKASSHLPWEGGEHIAKEDSRGWQPLSASAIAAGGGLRRIPKSMTIDEISRASADFASAAVRARDAGVEWLELHFAHGYLAMNFFSRYSNRRTDEYGGSFVNRTRFLRETAAAVREVWPEDRPFAIRLGTVEYDGRDDENLGESIELCKQFKSLGVDMIDVSLGLSAEKAHIPRDTPAFLAPVAQRIRVEAGIPVMASFRLENPRVAENAIANGQLDLVAVAKGMLSNPHWPYYAARKLGLEKASGMLPVRYAYWLDSYLGE